MLFIAASINVLYIWGSCNINPVDTSVCFYLHFSFNLEIIHSKNGNFQEDKKREKKEI